MFRGRDQVARMPSPRTLPALLVVAGLLLAGSTDPARAQSDLQPKTCVYLLRGLGGRIFTMALDDLATRLKERNICAMVRDFGDYPELTKDAEAKYKSGEIQTVIIVGQSLGGGMATRMAKSLNGSGVPVSLLLTVEPTFVLDVAANVSTAINLYLPNGLGRRLEPAANFHGRLFNLDQKNVWAIEHIWSFAILEDRIFDYVLAVAGPPVDVTGSILSPVH